MKKRINELRLWKDNPRGIKNDKFEELKNRIKRWGVYKPLVITPDGEVLGGNMRLRACQELGILEVPVTIVNPETEAEKVELAITDNQEMGFYQDQEVAELIDKYKDEIDLTKYGYKQGEGKTLQEILDQFSPVEEDEVPELEEGEPESKLGEVYQLGRHRLMTGDATKKEDVEKLMDGKKADMVFTDPPYGMDFQSNFRKKTPKFDKIKNDDVILDISSVLSIIMKKNTVAYVCTRWDLYSKWCEQLEKILSIKNCIVWHKKGGGLGDLENTYSPNHEFIIVGHNGSAKIRGKRDADVWEIGRDGFSDYEHPTQKPVALSSFAISHHSDKDDIVLDLFGGSGSTLIAAEQTGRVCRMMEIDERYSDVIRRRYAKFIGKEEEWQKITPIIR